MTLEWNSERWGSATSWADDNWGYAYAQPGRSDIDYTTIAKRADRFLRPYICSDVHVLEVAPGAGRFTVELLRYATTLHLVDLNAACLDICRKRFKWYRHIKYFQNDGQDCSMLPGNYDLIASYDSMVHMEPKVVLGYLEQFRDLLNPDGLVWIDHSGKGARLQGHRTAVTLEVVQRWASALGYKIIDQMFRNDHDCISVLQWPSL